MLNLFALFFGGRSLIEKAALAVLLVAAPVASYGAGYVVGAWHAAAAETAQEALDAEREAAKWLKRELETAQAAARSGADLAKEWNNAELANDRNFPATFEPRDVADRAPGIVFSARFLRDLDAIN